MRSKKAVYGLSSLPTIAMVLAVGILITSIVADIVSNINGNQVAGSTAKNISGQGLAGMKQIGLYFPTIGLVVAAAIIIGVLVSAFAFNRGN